MILSISYFSDRLDIIPVDDAIMARAIAFETLLKKSREIYSINICDDSGLIIERVWRCV